MDIIHDVTHHRFSATVDDRTAHLTYRLLEDDRIDLQSTYVPPVIRRRGVGQALVARALAYARQRGLAVVASCWFVRDVMAQDDGGGGPSRGC